MKHTTLLLSALLLIGGCASTNPPAPTTAPTAPETVDPAMAAATARVEAAREARPEAIPARPESLIFPELSYEPPSPDGIRHELSNGIPVYVVENHDLPLVDVVVFFHGGSYMDPEDKIGLASLVDRSWRSGGAGERDARTFDEELDFLAANLRAGSGATTGTVSLDVLSRNLEAGLELMMDLMTEPLFEEARVNKARDDMFQAMKRRNDSTTSIESRAWTHLLYGRDHWLSKMSSQASVEAITTDDLSGFVSRVIGAGNLVVAVSGDVVTDEVLALLDRYLGQLPTVDPVPAIPQGESTAAPGVYVVHKEDVNQGRVRIGTLGLRHGHPDEFSLDVMNDILGGGSFTSWIMKRVRSDEGLAYSAASSISFPTERRGSFAAFFQSKSPTVAAAIDITLGLIAKMQTTEVSADEMATAKASFIDTFPNRFESAGRTAATFASNELNGIEADYWSTYRDNFDAVTIADVNRVANDHLDPDNMVILIVGNFDDILAGSPDYEASIESFGEIIRVPLLDPMTLEPLE